MDRRTQRWALVFNNHGAQNPPFKNAEGRENMKATKVSYCSVVLALALVLSFIESMIPLPIPIPGLRLGLANIAVLVVLMRFSFAEAAAVSLLRVLLSALLFGTLSGFVMSLSGAVLSLCVMQLCKALRIFSPIGISVAGAAAHNTAQVAAVVALTGTPSVFYYLPFLLMASIPTGLLSGALALLVLKRTGRASAHQDRT